MSDCNCGVIYNKEAARVNASAPPGQWQSDDIEYHSPAFDAQGQAPFEASHHGRPERQEGPQRRRVALLGQAVENRRRKRESRTPGRITLQDHGDPADFRNVVLLSPSDLAATYRQWHKVEP